MLYRWFELAPMDNSVQLILTGALKMVSRESLSRQSMMKEDSDNGNVISTHSPNE